MKSVAAPAEEVKLVSKNFLDVCFGDLKANSRLFTASETLSLLQ